MFPKKVRALKKFLLERLELSRVETLKSPISISASMIEKIKDQTLSTISTCQRMFLTWLKIVSSLTQTQEWKSMMSLAMSPLGTTQMLLFSNSFRMQASLSTLRLTSAKSNSLVSIQFLSQPKINSRPLLSSTLWKQRLESSSRVLMKSYSLHANLSSMSRARLLTSVMKTDRIFKRRLLMSATLRKVLEQLLLPTEISIS